MSEPTGHFITAKLKDPKLMENAEIKKWCEAVRDRIEENIIRQQYFGNLKIVSTR